MATRWGVAGCGKITNDFLTSWKGLPAENHILIAVASRSLDKAQEFAATFNAKRAYDNYEELASDEEIEVVYIGVIHPKHLEIARMMMNAGKHVLCEKPLGMNVKETRLIVDLARKNKVFLMEAIWSRCFPTYNELKKRLETGEIGEVKAVTSNFSFLSDRPRLREKELGGSILLDVGIYCIQLCLFVFDGAMPTAITAQACINDDGVDDTVFGTLKFGSDKFASFVCSSRFQGPKEAHICGSKGFIKIDDFWCPEGFSSPGGEFVSKLPDISGSSFNFLNSQGLMYEAEEVRNCLKNGLLESPKLPLEDTLKIATIMEEMLKQLGLQH